MRKLLNALALLSISFSSGAAANGFGEAGSWSFRSPSDRQILLLGEQTRLNYEAFNSDGGVGLSSGAAGGQTGNSTTINITGNGDNTIDTTQDNTGDQTIQEANDQGTNTLTSDPGAAPVPVSTAISNAAAVLSNMTDGTE